MKTAIKNLSVKTKLWAIVCILLAGMILMSVVSIIQINRTSEELITWLYDESYASSGLILNVDRDMYQALDDVVRAAERINQPEADQYIADFEENLTQVKERMASAKDIFNKDQEGWSGYVDPNTNKTVFDFLTQFDSDFSAWVDTSDSVLKSHGSQAELDETFNTARENLNAMTDLIDLGAKAQMEQSIEEKNTAIIIFIAIDAFFLISALILVFILLNMLIKPLESLTEAANKLALGAVDIEVETDEDSASKDELGILMRSFSKMVKTIRDQAFAVEQLADGDLSVQVAIQSEKDLLGNKLKEMAEKNNEVLGNIAAAADQVAAGANQLADSSMSLSQGATEQASAIEELTASLEELTSQTKLNAQNASHANQLAETAKSNAVQGNMQMQQMLKAMEEINEASSNISKIIKVIDDIAFQTNILALNAAVEAARAGQSGKGFAVVADEVRSLAARSANAAKETTLMIEGSIAKAEGGRVIANNTAEALNKIVSDVEEVTGIINNISAASNNQAVGIEQINLGLTQISQVIQSNSAISEESASASEELSSQAEFLKGMIGKFKLRQNKDTGDITNDADSDILKMHEKKPDRKSFKKDMPKETLLLGDRGYGKY